MRYTYCEKCDDAFARTRFEGDRCIYCQSQNTQFVDVGYDWLYYAGYTIMILSAAIVLFYEENMAKWVIFFSMFIIGFIMSIRAKLVTRKKAVKMGREAAGKAQ